MNKAMRLVYILVLINYVGGQTNFENSLSVYDESTEGISEACARDVSILNSHMRNLTLWAMEMWEASARAGPGLLHGSNFQLGNFDECLEPMKAIPYNRVRGLVRQYCLAEVKFERSDPMKSPLEHSLKDPYRNALDVIFAKRDENIVDRSHMFWALCSPASCTIQDLNTFLKNNTHIHQLSQKYQTTYTASLRKESCQLDKSRLPYTPGAIAFIAFCGLLCVLSIIATICHWYLDLKNAQGKDVTCPDLVKSFSMINHLEALQRRHEKGSSLEITYGIRVISIYMIVVGHRLGTSLQGPLQNRSYAEMIYEKVWASVIFHQPEAFVDVFFVLSGMFSVYQLLKYTEKNRFNFVQFFVFRYIRLMPLYAFVIFYTATLLPQTGSGPLWSHMEDQGQRCRDNWWTNILMINNYVNVDKMCMIQSWYVPCDFHYFILAMLVCVIMKKPSRAKFSLGLMVVLFCSSLFIPMLVTYYMKLPGMMRFNYEFLTSPLNHQVFDNVYIKSHTRSSSYILGMFAGYILYKYYKDGGFRLTMLQSSVAFVLVLCVHMGLSCAAGPFLDSKVPYEPLRAAIFAGLYRPAKSACTCLFLLICIFGYVPIVSSFLSWTPWISLGKLSYAVYLIHMGLQIRAAASIRQPIYMDIFTMVQFWVGDPVLTFVLALVGYLLVEGPANMLLKIAFMPSKKKSPKDEVSLENGHCNEAMEMEDSRGNLPRSVQEIVEIHEENREKTEEASRA